MPLKQNEVLYSYGPPDKRGVRWSPDGPPLTPEEFITTLIVALRKRETQLDDVLELVGDCCNCLVLADESKLTPVLRELLDEVAPTLKELTDGET